MFKYSEFKYLPTVRERNFMDNECKGVSKVGIERLKLGFKEQLKKFQ